MHSTRFDDHVVAPTRRRLTVKEYHRMGKAGILGEDDRVELIDGELVTMAPIGSNHAYIVDLMNDMLVRQVLRKYWVRIQNPIRLGEFGEPEPDVAIVNRQAYRLQHPEARDVLLLIEVADSSLDYDRTTKLPYYARFAIPEVWIIDVEGKRMTVNRQPLSKGEKYDNVSVHSKGILVPERIPEVELKVEDVWA